MDRMQCWTGHLESVGGGRSASSVFKSFLQGVSVCSKVFDVF